MCDTTIKREPISHSVVASLQNGLWWFLIPDICASMWSLPPWGGLIYVTSRPWRKDELCLLRLRHNKHFDSALLSLGSLTRWEARWCVVRPFSLAALRQGAEASHRQPCDWTIEEADHPYPPTTTPAPGKPSDDCNLGWHGGNYNLSGGCGPKTPRNHTPKLLTHKNYVRQ